MTSTKCPLHLGEYKHFAEIKTDEGYFYIEIHDGEILDEQIETKERLDKELIEAGYVEFKLDDEYTSDWILGGRENITDIRWEVENNADEGIMNVTLYIDYADGDYDDFTLMWKPKFREEVEGHFQEVAKKLFKDEKEYSSMALSMML